MHFGDAMVVLADEPEQDLGIDPARIFVDPPHNAEIQRHQRSVVGDLQVPLVHVGVEISVAQRVAQKHRQNALADRICIVPLRPDRLDLARRNAVNPGQRHHPARRQIPFHRRHEKSGVAFGIGGELGRRCGLQPQIQFGCHHAVEMRNNVHRAQPPGRGCQRFDHAGGEIEGVDIAPERSLDPGPQDLDRDLLAGCRQAGLMDLGDGRRRDRIRKLAEVLIDRDAQLARNGFLRHLGRKRRQLVLQYPELNSQILANNIRPRGKKLPELDIGRAQRRQRSCRRR